MRSTITSVVVFLLAALSTGSFAGEIRKGTTMQMKPNSIWFQDTSYQDEVLSHRVAWQFINALTVKILRYKPRTHQVNVEMTEPGRLEGTEWWLDADALVR